MTSLEFVEYADLSGGMNKAVPSDQIADNEVAHLQDMIPGQPGRLFSRGQLDFVVATDGSNSLSSYSTLAEPHGIYTVQNLAGTQVLGACGTTGGGSSVLGFFTSNLNAYGTNATLASAYPLKGLLPVVSARPRLGGGINIGISNGYEQSHTNRNLAVWHGSTKVDYSTGTITYALNSTTVTGVGTLFTANAEPGMYLFAASGLYLGMVVTVTDNTHIVLDRPPPAAGAGVTYTLKSIRGLAISHGGGLISTFTDSTAVIGSGTSFLGGGLNAFSWSLFRASDNTFIGTVSSVASDTGLTLGANAAVALTNEEFTAVRTDLVNSIALGNYTPWHAQGFLTTTYVDRQWYANFAYTDIGFGSYLDSVWFSEERRPEVINASPADGNRIVVANTKPNVNAGIRGFMAGSNGIVVAKDRETHVIVGDSPDNFANQKILDDGCIGSGTMQGWNGGVVWAGWDGIWYWDGAAPQNITLAKLGDWYKNTLAGFMENSARAWGFVYRDYYVLHVEQLRKPVSLWQGTRNGVSNLPIYDTASTMVLAVHIPTGAVSFLRGVNLYGAVKYTGATVGEQLVGIGANATGGSSNNATVNMSIFKVNNVIDNGVTASLTFNAVYKDPTSGNWFFEAATTPRPYLETKAYDVGSPLVKKAWRSLLMHYKSDNATIGVIPLIDPDPSQGQVALADYVASTTLTVKRVKYVRRSRRIAFQILGFAVNDFTIKSIGMTFKRLPVGRP